MLTKTVTVEDAGGAPLAFVLRELTFAERKKVEEGMGDIDLLQAVCKGPAMARLPDLPVSHGRELLREIFALTWGTEEQRGNSPSTGGPSPTPPAASTATPAAG